VTEAVEVRAMSRGDVADVVALQRTFLHGSIVTALGDRFLTRLYVIALSHSSTRAFVVRSTRGVAAAAVGTIDIDAFNRYVKRRVFFALVTSLLSPARFRLVPRFVRSLLEPEPLPHIAAELLLLVVDARERRQGIARTLLLAVESAFAHERVSLYRVAVRTELDVARQFYGALGFVAEQELPVLGRPMSYLTKRLP
jgi:GNAT superfamily N-acetyltransferase